MKKISHIIFLVMLLFTTSACEKDLPLYSTSDCRLNFVYYYYNGELVPSASVTDAMRTQSYSFFLNSASAGEDLTSDTVWFEVTTMGFLSDKDRPISLKQITVEGENNAVAGKHFVAFDDPSYMSKCYVAANQNKTMLPIVLLRDPSLKEKEVVLKFEFAENDYFKPGYTGLTERSIIITDQLSKPSNWRTDYFGTYGPVKHQLMIEWTQKAWDESYIDELLNGDKGYISYLSRWFREKLAEENSKRQEQGLDVYKEADGTPVYF